MAPHTACLALAPWAHFKLSFCPERQWGASSPVLVSLGHSAGCGWASDEFLFNSQVNQEYKQVC